MALKDEIKRICDNRKATLQALFNKVPVLDKGYVELVDLMGDEDAPVDAARVSFAKSSENYTSGQNDRLTKYLLDHDHGTPFEMVTFKFRVHAPVLVWWHWVRHRMASYNFVSGRYVSFDENQFMEVAADQWRLQSVSNKQGSSGEFLEPGHGGTSLTRLLEEHVRRGFHLYQEALDLGVAKEQARLFLPFAACYYTAIVQMNARSLMNFLDLRGAGTHAQSEIQGYAEAIKQIVSKTHPRLFSEGRKK